MPRPVLRLKNPHLKGEAVRLVQRHLIALGFGRVGRPDGDFGGKSDRVVRAFQRARGLPVTGIVGTATWRAFDEGREHRAEGFAPPLTLAQLQTIVPRISDTNARKYLGPLDQTMARWTITTPLRRAHFLAQIAHESASFTATRENLNYSADGLRAVFFKYFAQPGEPEAFARQPERIANRVYANRLGNGPESSGDGWCYRGRGLIQLTGKANYRLYSNETGVDFVVNPDAIATSVSRCTDVAGWYWDRNGIHLWADQDDVLTVTKRINGGTHGLDERERFLRRAKRRFGI